VNLVDEVGLHEVAVALEVGEGLFAGSNSRTKGSSRAMTSAILASMAARSSGVKGLFAVEVVEEAAVGGGAVAELGFGEELEDGGGHDVRGGVADDLEGFGVALLDEGELGVFGERRGEVDEARRRGIGAEYMASSLVGFLQRWSSAAPVMVAEASGVRRATTETAARRGEMALAICPAALCRRAPREWPHRADERRSRGGMSNRLYVARVLRCSGSARRGWNGAKRCARSSRRCAIIIMPERDRRSIRSRDFWFPPGTARSLFRARPFWAMLLCGRCKRSATQSPARSLSHTERGRFHRGRESAASVFGRGLEQSAASFLVALAVARGNGAVSIGR
jgi:hypothetical protein